MFKKKIELIKPIIYRKPEQDDIFQYGQDNRLYRSLIRLFEAFVIQSKKELYLVGGGVRDLLLGREPKDYDLCTNATPKEAKKICEDLGLKTFDSGIKHGTITVIDEFYDQSYELTSFRKDGKYTDGRHPDTVKFGVSLEEDLKRRDFTINSFAYDFLRNELIALDESYFDDLEYGIIRTVGDPAERYEEDALRMLRAIRFAAQLNFTINRDTYAAIKELAPRLSLISKERIRDELTKILLSDKPDMLKLFAVSGLEEYAFGFTPLMDMMKCEHQNPWHYADVFHHTMDVVNGVPKTFELRWAALLHDTGKPAVKSLKEGTTDHYTYHGHQDVSAEITLRLAELLKFSNEQKDLVYKFVKYHDEPLAEVRNAKFKTVVNEIGKEHFADFIKLRASDSFAHRLLVDTKYAVDFPDKVKERFMEILENDQALTVKDLDINGYDLMAVGFKGKEIGDFLRFCLELVLEEPSLNKKEVLLRFVDHFKENQK